MGQIQRKLGQSTCLSFHACSGVVLDRIFNIKIFLMQRIKNKTKDGRTLLGWVRGWQ